MDRSEYVEQLKALGHFRAAVVTKDNGRFYATCECGYRSTTRTSAREAVDTINHHRSKVLAAARTNGQIPRVAAPQQASGL